MDFDLILLDIDLGPGGNGMELARRIRSRDERAAILFITGLAEYMSQGYDVRACHSCSYAYLKMNTNVRNSVK